MQRSLTTKISRYSIWLSILIHLVALIFLFTLIKTPLKTLDTKPQPTPNHFVPAYTYTGSIKPSTQHAQKAQAQSVTSPPQQKQQTKTKQINAKENTQSPEMMQNPEPTQHALSMQKPTKKISHKTYRPRQPSLLSASFDMLKEDQLREVSKTRDSEPIYLVGDDNSPADPLIILMGRSLSAHFAYPRTAGELGIKGKVVIELTLHPEGYYSDVQILRSSSNHDLDGAALYAVNSAPKVIGANRYITKPRHFVVGFIFH